jgi:hypothetical protein
LVTFLRLRIVSIRGKRIYISLLSASKGCGARVVELS